MFERVAREMFTENWPQNKKQKLCKFSTLWGFYNIALFLNLIIFTGEVFNAVCHCLEDRKCLNNNEKNLYIYDAKPGFFPLLADQLMRDHSKMHFAAFVQIISFVRLLHAQGRHTTRSTYGASSPADDFLGERWSRSNNKSFFPSHAGIFLYFMFCRKLVLLGESIDVIHEGKNRGLRCERSEKQNSGKKLKIF